MFQTFVIELSRFLQQLALSLFRGNDSRLAGRLRRLIMGINCKVDTDVYVRSVRNFAAGDGCALYHGCYILNSDGYVSMGKRSHLGANTYLNAKRGRVTIGDHVAIGPGVEIIAYSNHYEPGQRVTDSHVCEDISIGNNVFIGANVCILPGSRIGDNVVVAAGAVVRGVLESDAIYGGAPARALRQGWYSGRVAVDSCSDADSSAAVDS